jgi:hypothetical protein
MLIDNQGKEVHDVNLLVLSHLVRGGIILPDSLYVEPKGASINCMKLKPGHS